MKSRNIFIFASLLLVLTFLFPIWNINLDAPQYPEGLGLYIWVNKITGENEKDLENINKLNHYIGMKVIDEESIPELTYMPIIITALVIAGILFGILRKRRLYLVWVASIVIFMIIGLYDFYMWEFDYGHNLNPDAPIKIPGMSYQPPLLGSKQILNMYSTSLPDVGSFIIGIAVIIALYAYYLAGKEN